MDQALARSGARLRSARARDNQEGMTVCASISSLSSPEDRGRAILMRLLEQITAFLERKELMSTRIAASNEWSQSRSRRCQKDSSNYLFEVVIDVCEQRMRRLKRSSFESYDGRQDNEWSSQSPRQLVAEAIVQELLVSLMELRMKEKETMVMHEVESVEIMHQLHGHLQKDEELVRSKVCIGAGDEQQLNELQLMLRTDFLEEVASVESPQKKQQMDSAANSDASLQFAWETIDDQKKEIIRLRADNERLKASSSFCNTATPLCLQEDPRKVLNVLRSQLSSHQFKNLDLLQSYIQQLEKALQSASGSPRKATRKWDGSKSTVDSTRSSDTLLSRSAMSTDFSSTQVHSKRCKECRKHSALLLSLRSQLNQLRAQAERDEDSLLQAEKDNSHIQRENSALSSALLSAKQKQEELRQMILNLTQEKHELQNLSDSEQRTSERSIYVLQEQLNALQEQKAYVKQKFDELKSKYDSEGSEKRAIAQKCIDLQNTNATLSRSMTELQLQVAKLNEAAQKREALVQNRDAALKDGQTAANRMEQEIVSRTAQLQEKNVIINELRTELGDVQRCLDVLEVEKSRSAGEVQRLLETLNECKRKNQRLEKGFEELQQGKELLANLQQVKSEASILQLKELEQTRDALEAIKAERSSARSECTQLEQSLADANKARLASDTGHNSDIERMEHELNALTRKCSALEQELKKQKTIQSEIEIRHQEHCAHATNLSKEIEESKVARQMWIDKYKTLTEDKQIVEDHVQSLYEEQCRLQRIIDELYAERETKCQEKDEKILTLKNEISSWAERHQTLEREIRSAQNEKKTMHQLVQTLQARPDLQQRVLREMLIACQRRTEYVFCHLSEKVRVTLRKLTAVEKRYETLKLYLTERRSARGTIRDDDYIATPQIFVHEDDCSSSSIFSLSTSQPVWLEAIASSNALEMDDFCHQEIMPIGTARTIAALELQRWKWKYFGKCLATSAHKQENDELIVQLKRSSSAVDHLKRTTYLFTWYKLITTMTNRRLDKQQHLSAVLIRRLLKELLQRIQSHCFAKWRHQAQKLRQTVRSCGSSNSSQPSITPTLTLALASCIQLIRSFCEPPRKAVSGKVSQQAESSLDHGADELTNYIVEIKTKAAKWKVAVESRIAEYANQNNQLKVVQQKCADLKALVGLNQRLIEEMERRSAGEQNVVKAAQDFARAYQVLSPSARSQVFQSRDFLSASKGIVQGLSSLGVPRIYQSYENPSSHTFSQTLGPTNMRKVCGKATTSKKVHFLSASAAPSVKTRFDSSKTEKARKRLNNSNIELLEEAVCSLKGAMQQQRNLQEELKEKERSLTITTKELHKRDMQYLLLRSFLRWKGVHQNGPNQ